MVVFNYSGAEINAKVVYYGPALSGKTTNLEYIYEQMPNNAKGKMVSMKTRTDRTLFFDFLPLELGDINGYRTRILLYTVPGQVYYNATRKLVLKGADAVVFVADSSPRKMDENVESLRNLEDNLNEHGLTLDTIPWVIQYNKRDLSDALPAATLDQKLNLLNVPSFEAIATSGEGIYDTFQSIARILYAQLTERLKKAQPAPAVGRAGEPAPLDLEDPMETAAQPRRARPADVVGDGEESGEAMTEVIDAALRELDGDRGEGATPEAHRGTDAEFQFEKLDKPNKEDAEVGRVIDFDNDTPAPRPAAPAPGEFVLDPFQSGYEDEAGGEKPNPRARKAAAPAKAPPPPPKRAPVPPPKRAAVPPPKTVEKRENAPERRPKAPPPPPDDSGDVTIKVPVTLSRSQVGRPIPITVELEIQFVDDEE